MHVRRIVQNNAKFVVMLAFLVAACITSPTDMARRQVSFVVPGAVYARSDTIIADITNASSLDLLCCNCWPVLEKATDGGWQPVDSSPPRPRCANEADRPFIGAGGTRTRAFTQAVSPWITSGDYRWNLQTGFEGYNEPIQVISNTFHVE